MNKRILVVDDSQIFRSVLRDEFRGAGFSVEMASSGEDCLRIAREMKPDLITLDVEMPGMNGYETCRRLREDEATMDIPVVMITSMDTPEERARGFGVGAVEYFTKPFEKSQLVSYVRSIVGPPKEDSGYSILIADDSRMEQYILKYLLTKEGHRILEAKDGDEALTLLSRKAVSLIILDIFMPRIDGFELCKSIKFNPKFKYTPLLIITSSDQRGSLKRALEMGADDYITRPFYPEEFIARVNAHLRIKKLYDELQAANERLKSLSVVDPLTSLYNRRHLHEQLEREIKRARRDKTFLGCVIIDIDNFKSFNDTYGHRAGDLVLKSVASELRRNCRATDIIARYGGEEFVIILPNTNMAGTLALAEKTRSNIEKMVVEVPERGEQVRVTVSIGTSNSSWEEIESPARGEVLLKRADMALYLAKRSGRNCVKSENDVEEIDQRERE
ncbi:MAG: response regulator [bacterium]